MKSFPVPGMEAFVMWTSIVGWMLRRVQSERSQLGKSSEASWDNILPVEKVEATLRAEGVRSRDCLYSPPVTLWTFLPHVLSPDHSFREAVARLRGFLTGDGQAPCHPDTSPYCKAWKRLPEQVFARLARDVGRELDQRVHDRRLLGGRSIKLVDGKNVSLPDTTTNQREYSQPNSQKPWLGFPLARIVGLLSLVSGAAMVLTVGPYAGKETGETALFRQLFRALFTCVAADCLCKRVIYVTVSQAFLGRLRATSRT